MGHEPDVSIKEKSILGIILEICGTNNSADD